MLTINEQGNVAFKSGTGNGSYDLGKSDEYEKFLIWVTDPNETVVIDAGEFEPDPNAPETETPKLQRYSEFLTSYLGKRCSLLAGFSASGATAEARKAHAQTLIARLKGEQDTE